ncbi:MAG: hypothetical protein HY873_07825 [Chloroflexi bacterium]|nr:hypothetical protein [Chloroflexota bacterium]
MPGIRTILLFTLSLAAISVALASCDDGAAPARGTPTPRAIPSSVAIRSEPEGISLADPAFEALPGATADYGRLGGTVYRIEMPDEWNGRVVLYMHGFEELRSEARVSAPDFRRYLIGNGYAWGASSFSSTSLIPGRAADETAALWDLFVQKHGRPAWTYVTGESMGGAATHIAAERYPDRFDGALALCGSAGNESGARGQADFFAAGAYVAGVTQGEFETADSIPKLISERILPALDDPITHERFESIMIDLTGGPRMFDREGFRAEEETNWRRTQMLVSGGLAPNIETEYRLGPLSAVSSEEFNRDVVRLPTQDELVQRFVERNETTGDLQMPMLTMHTTGDGQVPIEQARILRQRVEAAGKGDLLVQRVIADPGHCGFNTSEQEAGFEALVAWVEGGARPEGDDVLVDDLRTLGSKFALLPRSGSPEEDAVPGAAERVVIRGNLMLDGEAFDARWVGAVVRREGLVTPCQLDLPPIDDGRYEITVMADAESTGCGSPGGEILLWTYANDTKLYSQTAFAWPEGSTTGSFDTGFSTAEPQGAAPLVSEYSGEVYTRGGGLMPPGTLVEAYIGGVRCGVASTRRTGSFRGYILSVVGPDSVAGCERGAVVTLLIDGEPAAETVINGPRSKDARGGTTDLSLR